MSELDRKETREEGQEQKEPERLQGHGHYHDPEEKKRQINRLARIIGHLEHVKRMLEADEDCSAVLMQLSATRSALNGLSKQIIKEHMAHCIVHAIEDGDMEAVERFQEAIQRYME